MQKRYQIKVYQKDWTFKTNLRENEVLSWVSFSENINWGQWEISILLNRDFNNDEITESDFVKISLYDENFPNWKLVYTWIIEEINRIYKSSENKLELSCRGLSSLLTRFYFKSGVDYIFNKNEDAGAIFRSIVDYFNSVFPWNWLNKDWIENTWVNSNIDFWYDTCFKAMQKVQETTNFNFCVKADWTVNFKAIPNTNIHSFTAKKDVQNLEINIDAWDIKNVIIVDYDWWTVAEEDNASKTSHWISEKQFAKWEFKAEDTARNFALSQLELYKNPKKQIELEINTNYILENINVWETIKVKNINYEINIVQIIKIDYAPNLSKLYLDKINSVWEILNN